jgi:hypothetical protein
VRVSAATHVALNANEPIGLKISTKRPKKTTEAGRCLAASSFHGPTLHGGDIEPGRAGMGDMRMRRATPLTD